MYTLASALTIPNVADLFIFKLNATHYINVLNVLLFMSMYVCVSVYVCVFVSVSVCAGVCAYMCACAIVH